MRYVGNFRVGFHATSGYLHKMGTPMKKEDLEGHRLVGFDRKTPFIRAILQNMKKENPAIPDADQIPFATRADSNLAQLALVRAGAGIGMCQIGLAKRDERLTHILPEFEVALHTWVAMHENLRTSPRCRAVFTALVDGLKAHLKATDPEAPSSKR